MAIFLNNEFGEVSVSLNVIAKLAGAVATKCYGVVGMASKNKKDGFVSLLNVDNITKGVKVLNNDSGIEIELHIIVKYGVNINAICDSIIHNVTYKVEQAIGMSVNKVSVQVESVRVEE